jgi:hypothetical protein
MQALHEAIKLSARPDAKVIIKETTMKKKENT